MHTNSGVVATLDSTTDQRTQLHFFTIEDGRIVMKGVTDVESSVPTSLCWCHDDSMLAVAWQNGTCALYRPQGTQVVNKWRISKGVAGVPRISFDPLGLTLLSVDESSQQVTEWSLDGTGDSTQPQATQSYALPPCISPSASDNCFAMDTTKSRIALVVNRSDQATATLVISSVRSLICHCLEIKLTRSCSDGSGSTLGGTDRDSRARR